MTYLDNKLRELIKIYPEFENFYIFNLQHRAKNTQKSYVNGLSKIFSILHKYDATKYTKEDIGNLISHEEFKKLSNKTKNYYLTFLKTYLKYYIEDEETYEKLEKSITRYKEQDKKIDKNDLITRKELDLILRNVDVKKKAMIQG